MKDQRISAKTFHDASAILLQEMLEEEEKYVPSGELSPEFRSRMETLLKQQEVKKVRKRHGHRRFWRVAAIIMIVLLSWLAFDKQARASVAAWIKSVVENVFQYNFSGSAVDGEMPVYRLGWYPEGGEIKHEENNPEREYSVFVQYGEEKGFSFSYGRFDEGVVFSVDPLGHEIIHSVQNIGGQEMEVYYDTVTLDTIYIWMNEKENLYFSLWSMLDHETNIRIIEDILKGKR